MGFNWRPLGLLFVLLMAQHGAVVHELSHLPGASRAEIRVRTGDATEAACALCPAYAQATAAAFSHALHAPLLLRGGLQRSPGQAAAAIEAAAPAPRSRGPPVLT